MAYNKLRLEGKVAVVTGGASGIGEATVRLFAAQGASVVIADIDDSRGHLLATSILPPGRATFVHCDVRNENHLAAAVNLALATYSSLDIMFSNAGVLGSTHGILDLHTSELNHVLSVNVCGTASAIKHAGLAMVAAGTRGSIICTASVSSLQGGMASVAYTASKHAVLGLMRSAASELGGKGVRVNCISPYLVATPMACNALAIDADDVEGIACVAAPLKGSALRVDDLAEAALFLASDESAFISGHNLVIDGGVTSSNTMISKVAEDFLKNKNG